MAKPLSPSRLRDQAAAGRILGNEGSTARVVKWSVVVKDIQRRKEKGKEVGAPTCIRLSMGGYDLRFTEEDSEAQRIGALSRGLTAPISPG